MNQDCLPLGAILLKDHRSGSVDFVGKLVVFNIGGNKFRLIAGIDYRSQVVYVKHILTHKVYDEGTWKA